MNPAPFKRPVLVVDDEPEMLFSLKGLLRPEFEVFTAGSAAEGAEILQKHVIHLVMTDQRMPQVTGVEFLSRIKNEHPAAMRLIFTGYADIKAVIDAINQGNVFRYITKPWDPEELLEALREAGQRYDHLAHRNRLLTDLRNYESRCVSFADDVLAGRHGTLKLEAVAEAQELIREGRELISKLDATLVTSLNEPAR
jgi:DNA-binding NtrC family response regulator